MTSHEPIRLAYLSDAEIPSSSANASHIVRMCDAFLATGFDARLYAPAKRRWRHAVAVGAARTTGEYYGCRYFADPLRMPKVSDALPGKLLYAWRLAWRARQETYELVYTRDVMIAAICAMLGLPTILESHFPIMREGRFKQQALRRFLGSRHALGLVVITRALASEYLRAYPELGPRLHIAPDAADVPTTVPDRAAQGGGRLRAGYVGSLYHGKGIDLILRVAPLAPEVDFVIYGGRPAEIDHWRSQARSANVRFAGYIAPSEVPSTLASLDVGLLPNQRRVVLGAMGTGVGAGAGLDIGAYTSPLKLFEYMASALPVIASDLPVLREAVSEAEVMFADPEDPVAWAERLRQLGDARLRARLGAAARDRAERDYSWDARVNGIVQALFPR